MYDVRSNLRLLPLQLAVRLPLQIDLHRCLLRFLLRRFRRLGRAGRQSTSMGRRLGRGGRQSLSMGHRRSSRARRGVEVF